MLKWTIKTILDPQSGSESELSLVQIDLQLFKLYLNNIELMEFEHVDWRVLSTLSKEDESSWLILYYGKIGKAYYGRSQYSTIEKA